jgi:hypothetical protein
MKFLLKTSVPGLLAFCLVAPTEAAITNALWTFPSSTTPGPVSPIAADVTTFATNAALSWVNGGSHLNESYVSNPGKTTALEFSYSGNQASSMNGTTMTLASTVTGLPVGSSLTNVSLTYETRWSNTGTPMTQTWAYSVDGGGFTNFLTLSVAGSAWQTNTYTFAGLQLQDGDTLMLRDTFSGASGNGQSLDFDDLQIAAAGAPVVPEPSSIVLAFLGGFAGLVFLRRPKRVFRR